MSERSRLHLRIYGRVQGVYFRVSTVKVARDLSLSGWVRNRRDGTVEVVVEGTKDAILVLKEWCHHGPEMADVQKVEACWEEPVDMENEFDVRPSR